MLTRLRGFSFIELVVTLAIIATLASMTVPLAELVSRRNKEQELLHALRDVRNALEAYKQAGDEGRIPRQAGESGYPATLQVLADGVIDARSPSSSRIRFLRRVPRDPLHPDEKTPSDQTWGKRSYTSSADAPREGEDVYDVYSLNPGSGLNGVPYKEW